MLVEAIKQSVKITDTLKQHKFGMDIKIGYSQ